MSITNVSQTIEINPISFTQTRCEFRIPKNNVYLSNMRILDLGLSPTPSGPKLAYPSNTGAWNLIKTISLYNGGVLIDQLREADEWMAWQNVVRNTNGENSNKFNVIEKSLNGYQIDYESGKYSRDVPVNTVNDVNRFSMLYVSDGCVFLKG